MQVAIQLIDTDGSSTFLEGPSDLVFEVHLVEYKGKLYHYWNMCRSNLDGYDIELRWKQVEGREKVNLDGSFKEVK